MLGFSVYLNQMPNHDTYVYIQQMRQAGFTGVFTSLQIPEENSAEYRNRVQRLSQMCKQLKLSLTADVSAVGLSKIGVAIDDPAAINQLGPTALRIDGGIGMAQVAKLSQQMPIALNASTISVHDIQELQLNAADFQNLEAWHNYYPRPETGLDETWVASKNRWLKSQGFTTMAFVPGDTQLRGPVSAGLPTLERDRSRHPLAATIDLLNSTATDRVFIGDPVLSTTCQQQFQSYFSKSVIQLPIVTKRADLLATTWHNRADVARDVVRLVEGRQRALTEIRPNAPVQRPVGSITEDNSSYGRYMGELQIMKHNLPANPRVNVIGQVAGHNIDLLPLIGAGQAIQLIDQDKRDGGTIK